MIRSENVISLLLHRLWDERYSEMIILVLILTDYLIDAEDAFFLLYPSSFHPKVIFLSHSRQDLLVVEENDSSTRESYGCC